VFSWRQILFSNPFPSPSLRIELKVNKYLFSFLTYKKNKVEKTDENFLSPKSLGKRKGIIFQIPSLKMNI
jgi:hypothetical protein